MTIASRPSIAEGRTYQGAVQGRAGAAVLEDGATSIGRLYHAQALCGVSNQAALTPAQSPHWLKVAFTAEHLGVTAWPICSIRA